MLLECSSIPGSMWNPEEVCGLHSTVHFSLPTSGITVSHTRARFPHMFVDTQRQRAFVVSASLNVLSFNVMRMEMQLFWTGDYRFVCFFFSSPF